MSGHRSPSELGTIEIDGGEIYRGLKTALIQLTLYPSIQSHTVQSVQHVELDVTGEDNHWRSRLSEIDWPEISRL